MNGARASGAPGTHAVDLGTMAVPARNSLIDAELAALAWYIELGADEAIGETPVDRFAAPEGPPAAVVVPPPAEEPAGPGGPAEIAAGCADLAALRAAMEAFEGCALKQGARHLVFADGHEGARVMIVGDVPDREEDRAGRPFVGPAGQMLDLMLAAIGLDRRAETAAEAVYLVPLLPWRPPGDRAPAPGEVAAMLPFLARHIALKAPEVLVLMGGAAARALLGAEAPRAGWTEWRGLPVLVLPHPRSLPGHPERKRAAWAELLALRAHLNGGGDGN